MPIDQATLNRISSFIWGISDDVLRDLFRRGKRPDVILPMCVIRRFDAVLETTKQKVLETKRILDDQGIASEHQKLALCEASGQAFYNTSRFTLRDLTYRGNQQQLLADFEDYLSGFSANVQDIIQNFEFRNHLPKLSRADALGALIAKFLSPSLDLSPAGLDNHGMGTVFEELVRKFNEENNEEAGEHWTPRDAIRLMTRLVFEPVADQLKDGVYRIYDCTCGTGGMLTVAEETVEEIALKRKLDITTLLYGQEISPETYAVCKADMLLKGEGQNADNIKGGAEYSTLSNDAFRGERFDFMLANPPYGKSWKSDLELMGGKKGIRDPRFLVTRGEEQMSLVTRTSDGQMLFLANMVSKMQGNTEMGSRIAEVHNGSSLFTGDAGQGESNIRRWVIENDLLEAIVALPLNLFYNTGIATYIWVLSNRKPEARKGKVQLIDASQWFKPLRKNLGDKNCELSPEDIERITRTFLEFRETPESKIFPNQAFGYWKVTVERPLRLVTQLTVPAIETLRYSSGMSEIREILHEEFGDVLFTDFDKVLPVLEKRLAEWGEADEPESDDESEGDEENSPSKKKSLPEKKKKKLLDPKTWARDESLYGIGLMLREELGGEIFRDHNVFTGRVLEVLKSHEIKLGTSEMNALLSAVSTRDETAPPVIAKVYKPGKASPDPLRGLFEIEIGGKKVVVEYEPDSDLRDSEQIPLLEEGGIEAFIRREVLPYTPDAWIKDFDAKIGYEVSFTKNFYKPPKLRELAEIRADIVKLQHESEGLLGEIIKGIDV